MGEAIKARLLDERGSCCSRGARGQRNCYNKLVEDAKLQVRKSSGLDAYMFAELETARW